jgi:hypothetical protein
MWLTFGLSVALLTSGVPARAQAAPGPGSDTPLTAAQTLPTPVEVTFPSGDLILHGRLFVPDGLGPFPAILWNHGSEKAPGLYLPAQARPFVSAGYVFFAPVPSRPGHVAWCGHPGSGGGGAAPAACTTRGAAARG